MISVENYINDKISIAPLTSFRVLFGFIMAVSIIRFAANGWIRELYIDPSYYFTYYGFEWVQPIGANGIYLLYLIMLLSAIGIMLGWRYRWSCVLFFVSFTYVELIDMTNYLNHYYFVSLISFILIWLPANRAFSLDVYRGKVAQLSKVPAWTINCIKIQLGFVYFFAGIAKINSYWLLEAMPLKFWLPAKSHIPIIGSLFQHEWVAYLFSWTGAIYDLTVAFLLLFKPTRLFAFVSVVIFHLLTSVLFQIGMFPYIMILSTTIFFSPSVHVRAQKAFLNLFDWSSDSTIKSESAVSPITFKWEYVKYFAISFFLIQALLPFRYLAYPGDLFWSEQGYRFSWRVMLMEKAGYATFTVQDDDGKKEWVQNYDYLRPQQEKMMSTQPDMILQFAHYLKKEYEKKGFKNPRVYCDSRVTLNGRRSQALVNSSVDLANEKRGIRHKDWINDFRKN